MPKSLLLISVIIFSAFAFVPRAYAISDVLINEFLAHPSSGNKEWVEFYNPSNTDLSNYFLDDDTDFATDSGTSAKKALSAINNSNQTFPYIEIDSFLNNSGDYVVLFSPSGEIIDQFQYTSDPGSDVSFGRSPDGSGSIGQLSSATKGSANTQAFVAPTPDPSPYPSPSPSLAKSSSPTPTSSTIKSPSPSSKISPTVLGEKDQESPSVTPSASPSESPSPSPQAEESKSNIKIAGLVSGTGLILIGISFGLYLWYSKRLPKSPPGSKEDDKSNEKIF